MSLLLLAATTASATDHCCARSAGFCPARGPCCLPTANGTCDRLSTRRRCERAASAVGPQQMCAWVGGHCVEGSSSDCPEAAEPMRGYYGEYAGFESMSESRCPGLRKALSAYAVAHAQATRGTAPPEGTAGARLLVIRDHWKNVGMGFMPFHVANVVLFAISTVSSRARPAGWLAAWLPAGHVHSPPVHRCALAGHVRLL